MKISVKCVKNDEGARWKRKSVDEMEHKIGHYVMSKFCATALIFGILR